jgi:DNA-binding MarR family transcriptional regulator
LTEIGLLQDDHIVLPVLWGNMKRGTSPAVEDHPIGSREAGGVAAQPPSCGDLGWAINVVFRTFRETASASLADLPGGPRGYLVLSAVAQDRPRSQLALAQQLVVDKTAMTYLLDALERAGLVERRLDPADRRQRQIVLTPNGHCALEEFRGRLAEAEQRLLYALTPEEALVFRQLFDRVARSTQEVTEPCTVGEVADPDGGPCA